MRSNLPSPVAGFVVHCRERGENVERIISTLRIIIGKTVTGTTDVRSIEAINQHLLAWVLDAYYTRER